MRLHLFQFVTMLKLLILTLFPFAHAEIIVDIKVNYDPSKTIIDLTGAIVDPISETEQRTFGLSDDLVKQAVYKLVHKHPIEVSFLKKGQYNKELPPVTRTLIAKDATIVQFTSRRNSIQSEKYSNGVSKAFNVLLSDIRVQIDTDVADKFTKNGELTVNEKIMHKIDLSSVLRGNEININYTTDWDEDKYVKQPYKFNLDQITYVLNPGEEAILNVTGKNKILDIEVTYEAHLEGYVFCRFEKNYEHKLIAVKDILRALHAPDTLTFKEMININYYSDIKTSVQIK